MIHQVFVHARGFANELTVEFKFHAAIGTDGRFLSVNAITEEKLEKVRALSEIAKERNQTLAEMALAWVLKDGIVNSVLIGASKPSQILDNIKAIENTSFTSDELERIDKISLT